MEMIHLKIFSPLLKKKTTKKTKKLYLWLACLLEKPHLLLVCSTKKGWCIYLWIPGILHSARYSFSRHSINTERMEGRKEGGRKRGREEKSKGVGKREKWKFGCKEKSWKWQNMIPEVSKAQATASSHWSDPEGEKWHLARKGPSWLGLLQLGQVSLLRLGRAPPGTPLFQNDRPEIIKCWRWLGK